MISPSSNSSSQAPAGKARATDARGLSGSSSLNAAGVGSGSFMRIDSAQDFDSAWSSLVRQVLQVSWPAGPRFPLKAAYANVHTVTFPPGEIRGQITHGNGTK